MVSKPHVWIVITISQWNLTDADRIDDTWRGPCWTFIYVGTLISSTQCCIAHARTTHRFVTINKLTGVTAFAIWTNCTVCYRNDSVIWVISYDLYGIHGLKIIPGQLWAPVIHSLMSLQWIPFPSYPTLQSHWNPLGRFMHSSIWILFKSRIPQV